MAEFYMSIENALQVIAETKEFIELHGFKELDAWDLAEYEYALAVVAAHR